LQYKQLRAKRAVVTVAAGIQFVQKHTKLLHHSFLLFYQLVLLYRDRLELLAIPFFLFLVESRIIFMVAHGGAIQTIFLLIAPSLPEDVERQSLHHLCYDRDTLTVKFFFVATASTCGMSSNFIQVIVSLRNIKQNLFVKSVILLVRVSKIHQASAVGVSACTSPQDCKEMTNESCRAWRSNKERGNCRVLNVRLLDLSEKVSRIFSKYFVYQRLLRSGKKIAFLHVQLLPQPTQIVLKI
jgi:hypothetical protein